ncbi:uncharacterized protein LOC114240044 isoform X2 [Bombyx mandarina]|uniref:Uncharacterized protein LOC114240044 isoform X2 n=1 Tax=Bombyx mandarina TaxID=7092 RepID=A0A6J2JA78_BOMMA|nr:uncharacterized protein LOC114240044 isoform X2 [Bombyx mandarina]
MLKGRGRDPRGAVPPTPTMSRSIHSGSHHPFTQPMQRAPLTKPEPDYEVVEFPSDQYVNAKLNPPPPPPPRPPTGHPVDADASCGLCGGGGARVRCAECGRRALCASCDDMYHRHPKRRHHQRQALSTAQLREERPPLPPKVAPPVPPPRRHKLSGDRLSASPKPMMDQRRATLGHLSAGIAQVSRGSTGTTPINNHVAPHPHSQMPLHVQAKMTTIPTSSHIGSMPYLPTSMPHSNMPQLTSMQPQGHHTLGHLNPAWARQRGSLQGFNMHQNVPPESWEPENVSHVQNWNRPLRRGASVLELGVGGGATCGGCAQCAGSGWRYGSCASLDHPWQGAWQPPPCCLPPHDPRLHAHTHHVSQTPQPHRRVETRTMSRAASRAGSRAPSPAASVRSRASRRTKHRTPSPPLPSSDADTESEGESITVPPSSIHENNDNYLGPAPPPPEINWQCEHCTFVNEPGVRVCAVCCRTPTVAPKILVSGVKEEMEKLKIETKKSTPTTATHDDSPTKQNGVRCSPKISKERKSTGCGPSPPREEFISMQIVNSQSPVIEQNKHSFVERSTKGHDIAVGPSPPRDIRHSQQNRNITSSPQIDNRVQDSPRRSVKDSPVKDQPQLHSISVGPSPPRENNRVSIEPEKQVQKKSTGTSPSRDVIVRASSFRSNKTNVSNTGTSPPPQSISTQTYEVPKQWERAPSASRSRPRRRFRDESRRERSHSRHSLSSDTRESDRSVRTLGTTNRWEWREEDSSPGGDWDHGNMSRRASHLDLRRPRSHRRSGFYGSEAASPEPTGATRATSLEALSGAGRRETERGLELAKLMTEAERLGFSAAEVQAALAQSPAAPLAWLRSRWPSLCAGVRAAAARLAPDAVISELEARASLARHRGAMWPAVTECVERHRRQAGSTEMGEEGRVRGRVWGSPAGADDDAAPPRFASRRSSRAREDSSDEFEAPTRPVFRDDDWMFLPLDVNVKDEYETNQNLKSWNKHSYDAPHDDRDDVTVTLNILKNNTDEENFLRSLLENTQLKLEESTITDRNRTNFNDLIQSENDFIDAYNALTKASPLPNINDVILEPNSKSFPTDIIHDNIKLQNNKNEKLLIKGQNISDRKSTKNILVDEKKDNLIALKVVSKTEEQKSKASTIKNDNNIFPNNEAVKQQTEAQSNKQTYYRDVLEKKQPENKNKIQNSYDDKSQNLNDIVDNTQKLIQQMREELDSDMHSFKNNSTSHSEHESSSNEEQLTSYSDTDHETEESENITSDEDGNSKDTQNVRIKTNNSVRQSEASNRTSSEDNEQFEEAMDHIENQVDDFKNTNMAILDSIARSLQEEHIVTVEEIKPTIPVKKEDSNNNLYVAVNSFEEIYAQLNSTKMQQKIISESENILQTNTLPDITVIEKHAITVSEYRPSASFQLIISENQQPKLKGKLNTIEPTHENLINEPSPDNLVNVFKNTENHYESNKIEVLNTTQPFPPLERTRENNIERTNNDQIEQEQTINFGEINATQDEPERNDLEFGAINIEIKQNTENTELQIQLDNISQPLPAEESDNRNTNVQLQTIQREIEEIDIFNKVDQNERNGNANQIQLEPINIIKETPLQHQVQTSISTVNSASITEKTYSKNPASKSNIPKLIKNVFGTKTKLEKNGPKFVASKVPIRRASIKQYPAPAPPKSQFGHIQSGHVKQLQTRLFDTRPKNSNTVKESNISEPEPSTSTMSKKKPAPPPPIEHKNEQATSIQVQPTMEKKNNYFRETCRTEDEWTESDSESSQTPVKKPVEEINYNPPSPPPPLTLRRVSGQLVDLAKIRLPEGSPERQARMLLAEGATETWEQAQLAVELISRGIESSAALLAALECTDITGALVYLHQDCELCASRLPEHEMVSMLRCTHRCCRECARHYFTVQITERSIADCVCPYCKVPDLENLPEDAWLDYFAHLDILLKTLLETEVHELFQRKLRDRTLARDPNFRWCMECASGFFVHPKQKKLRCPECRSVSCASCRKPWTANHEGMTCEQYATWLDDNDPERSLTAIQQHLRDNGLECPRCRFKYSLSRGGCMHFTCTQCKYEFCYGCGKPFTMGARCGLSDYCAKLGLHAHHPRNCLFYLRDKEPHELQTLLQMNNVHYETEAAPGSTGRCPTQLQRETPTGLVDGVCGSEAPANYAGLCKNHYLEYLSRTVRRHGVDPLPILGVDDLETLVRRAALRLPPRPYGSLEGLYKRGLIEIVKEKIPLD